jgi:hypothetical protein
MGTHTWICGVGRKSRLLYSHFHDNLCGGAPKVCCRQNILTFVTVIAVTAIRMRAMTGFLLRPEKYTGGYCYRDYRTYKERCQVWILFFSASISPSANGVD